MENWFEWIPAFAGMTGAQPGMTEVWPGMAGTAGDDKGSRG